MTIKHFHLIAILLAAPTWHTLAHASADLGQAEQLIRSGQARQAYDLLAAEQFARAGDADFDYLFGLAALEAGQPSIATLAFERTLAVNPQHAAARLDMGRAYFILGDLTRARREFELAAALNPPPAARATLDRYLAEMDAREHPPATRARGYIEAGLGSDSNVTQGPGNSTLFLPLFGVDFTLNTASQKVRDDFSQVNAGADINHRLDNGLVLSGGFDGKWRTYDQITDFNYGSIDYHGGLQWQDGKNTWRTNAARNEYRLNDQQYRSISSASGEFRHALSERQHAILFGQYAHVRYDQEVQRNNNVNQWVLGAGWVAQLATSSPTIVSLSTFVGRETEADRDLPRVDGDKRFVGLRAGGQITPYPSVDFYATLGGQQGNYQRSNILYDRKRSDTQYEAAAGSVWRFAPAWSLKPQISWLHNDSTLSINDYKRYEISLFLRRDFQ